jgi:uroporphyrinogen-III synthase
VADGLAAKGWAVERVEAYRTVALAPPDPAHAARVAVADAIVFLAASSVEAYAAAAPSGGGAAAAPPLVVCIGATTAAAARAAGLGGVAQAPAASPEGLVAALVEHLGSPPGAGS